MTTEQAIRELKSDRKLYEGDIVYAGDGTPDGDLMFALDMGIAALKKQIPQKPTPSERQKIRYAMCFTCPSCGRDFSGTGIADYCYRCGQAIDWSDTDDYFENYNKEE